LSRALRRFGGSGTFRFSTLFGRHRVIVRLLSCAGCILRIHVRIVGCLLGLLRSRIGLIGPLRRRLRSSNRLIGSRPCLLGLRARHIRNCLRITKIVFRGAPCQQSRSQDHGHHAHPHNTVHVKLLLQSRRT
jgi:hypothetical protein